MCARARFLFIALWVVLAGLTARQAFAVNTLTIGTGTGFAGTSGDTVTVSLANTDTLAGIQLTLRDTPDVLKGLSVRTTSRLTGFTATINDTTGVLKIVIFGIGPKVLPGTGVILKINYSVFQGVAPGSVAIAGEDVILSNPRAQAVPVTVVNGTFTVPSNLALANHSASQLADRFGGPAPATVPLFRFRLTAAGETATITSLTFPLASVAGLTNDSFSSLEIVLDANGNGLIDVSETTTVGGTGVAAVTGSSGTLTFTASFTLPVAGGARQYILRGTVALAAGSAATISLGTGNLVATGTTAGTIVPTGSTTAVTHTAGGVTLSDPPASGQVADQVGSPGTLSNNRLFRFAVRADGDAATITSLVFGLSLSQLAASDLSGLALFEDTSGDGAPDGSAVASGPAVTASSITFSSLNLSLSIAQTRTFILQGTLATHQPGDRVTVTLGAASVTVRDGAGNTFTPTGSITSARQTAGSLTLANAAQSQVANQFTGTGTITDVNLFRFRLTAAGDTAIVTGLSFSLSMAGLTVSDLTGVRLFEDTTGDGLPDGGSLATSGTLTATAAPFDGLSLRFDPGQARTFILQATVALGAGGKTLSIGLQKEQLIVRDGTGNLVSADGSLSQAVHAQTGSLVLANHDSSQTANAFEFALKQNGAVADAVLFRFRLTVTGEADSVTLIRFDLAAVNGLTAAKLTNLRLIPDTDGNGALGSGELNGAVGGTGSLSLSGTTGTISFTSPFVVSEGIHAYLLIGNGNGLSLRDSMTVSLGATATIIAKGLSTGIAAVVSGTAAPARHVVMNHTPVIVTTLLPAAKYGAAYVTPISASDADDDTLSYALTFAPAWLSIGALDGVLRGTPASSDSGRFPFTVTVADTRGGSTTRSYVLLVEGLRLAEAPAGQVGDQFAGTGTFSNVNLFRFVMRADGDTMTVSEVTLTLGFSGLAPGGVTGLVLFEDTTGDGLPDGGPVTGAGTVTGTAASWTGLSLTIEADRARSFIVQGTVSDTQAGDRLTISLPVTGVVSRDRRGEAVPVIGAVSATAHTAGTFTLADAPSGQSPDQFRNAATAVDKDFFRFVLRTTGKAVTVSRLAFGLSFAQLTPQQLTAFRLLEDTTGDGVPDGGPLANSPIIRPDSLMFTGLALSLPAGGTRTFILRGTVALSRVGDRLTVGLALDGVVARNDSGSGVTASGATSSAVHHAAGVSGDVTFDLILDVRDVVKEIRVALSIIPIDGPLPFFDLNGDEAVDIVDIIAIIQRIVTGNVPVRRLAQPSDLTAHLTLQDVSINADGIIELTAALQSSGPLAGFEVTLVSSDPRVRWSEPLIAGRADGMTLASHGRDGTMRLILYSMTGGRIPAGDGPLVRLRLSLAVSDTGGTSLTVLKARGVDADVRPVPVTVPAKPAVLTVPPRAYALRQNTPNPFNPATVIRYDLPKPGHVTFTIYNLLGQAVVTLVDARQEAGRYAVRWDGRNAAGQPVASGLYFYRLTTGAGFTAVRKMVMVR